MALQKKVCLLVALFLLVLFSFNVSAQSVGGFASWFDGLFLSPPDFQMSDVIGDVSNGVPANIRNSLDIGSADFSYQGNSLNVLFNLVGDVTPPSSGRFQYRVTVGGWNVGVVLHSDGSCSGASGTCNVEDNTVSFIYNRAMPSSGTSVFVNTFYLPSSGGSISADNVAGSWSEESQQQICSEQNGDVCSQDETCPGSWLEASDSSRCCNVGCEQLACVENWQCGGWGDCENVVRTRTCTDLNNCGTYSEKPSETQNCVCVEDWSCGEWGECVNGVETRTCIDLNNCGTLSNKPGETQNCGAVCVEDWSCGEWGECVNEVETRTCTDLNACGTQDSNPDEVRNCEVASSCGNSFINAGEMCDGGNLNGQTCELLGYDGGSLACGDDCKFSVGGCYVDLPSCGEGNAESGGTCYRIMDDIGDVERVATRLSEALDIVYIDLFHGESYGEDSFGVTLGLKGDENGNIPVSNQYMGGQREDPYYRYVVGMRHFGSNLVPEDPNNRWGAVITVFPNGEVRCAEAGYTRLDFQNVGRTDYYYTVCSNPIIDGNKITFTFTKPFPQIGRNIEAYSSLYWERGAISGDKAEGNMFHEGSYCGNYFKEEGEECEINYDVYDHEGCALRGFHTGSLVCNYATCEYSDSYCIGDLSLRTIEKSNFVRYDWNNGGWDSALAALMNGDENLLVIGQSESTNGKTYFGLEYDKELNLISENVFDYPIPERGRSSIEAAALDSRDGSIIVVGIVPPNNPSIRDSQDIMVVKYDSDFNEIMRKRYNSGMGDFSSGLAVDSDGNIYVSGYSSHLRHHPTTTSFDALIIKYDENLNQLAVSEYNSPTNGRDFAYDMELDKNGNVIMGGSTNKGPPDNYRDSNMLILKYDSDLNLVSSKIYSGDADYNDLVNGVAADDDGNIFAVGKLSFFEDVPPSDTWPFRIGLALLKYGASLGDVEDLHLGRAGGGGINTEDILVLPNGEILVSGSRSGAIAIHKHDRDLDLTAWDIYDIEDSSSNQDYQFHAGGLMVSDDEENVFVVGRIGGTSFGWDSGPVEGKKSDIVIIKYTFGEEFREGGINRGILKAIGDWVRELFQG